VAGLMRELNGILGIESKLSMVFYPQTDKQTERVNQELKCIESNRNSIKFFLSTQTWSRFKLLWPEPYIKSL